MTLEPNIWLWLISFAPLVLLLHLMVLRRWGAAEAGVLGWLVTAVLAVAVFRLPLEAVGLASVKGAFESITIIYIVLSAILIYEVADAADAFAPFHDGMRRMFGHPLLQIMAIGWVFAGFLQGVTGFGVPVAVCAPLLIGIGVRPLYAVAIALIGQAWNNTFGTLGAAWVGLQQVTTLTPGEGATTAWQTAVLIAVVVVAGGLMISWLYGGFRGLREGLVAVGVVSLAQGGVTLALATWDATFSGFAAGLAALVAVAGLARLPMYRSPSRVEHSRLLMPGRDPDTGGAATTPVTQRGSGHGPAAPRRGRSSATAPATAGATSGTSMSFTAAFVPYYTLLVVTCLVMLIPPLNDLLSRPSLGLGFPSVETGLGFVTESSTWTFEYVTHAGTLLLVTAITSYLFYRRRGHLAGGAWRGILSNTVEKSVAPTIAVITLVGMATVMQASGQATVLATMVAAWTGGLYLLLAPIVGMFGTFITGSNMSSNLLFGNFQEATAQAGGLSTSAVLSAQTGGGAVGSAIAPSKILLGTTTAGITGDEGRVVRILLPFAIGVTLLLGAITATLS